MRTCVAAVALALGASACATSHSLPHPLRMPPRRPSCSVGVAPVLDDQGVDLGLELRDYLRQSGPCAMVRSVANVDDESVDVVVAGHVTSSLGPGGRPLLRLSTTLLGIGLGGIVGGAVLYAVAKEPAPDANGFVDPGAKNSERGMKTAGGALLGVGAALAAIGIGLTIAEEAGRREVSLKGAVDADFTFLRRGAPVDQMHLRDEVTARGRHPEGRPESKETPAAAGPLYREAVAHAFEHVAARLGDMMEERRTP